MKIRTDFVTNSSSSNYVTINIKNPKLAEIARAATICRKNGESDTDEDEDSCHRLDMDASEQFVKLKLEISHILEYDDEADLADIGYPPDNLSGLSKSLIRLLKKAEGYPLRGYDFTKLYRALEKNSEDILADMESVDWTYDAQGHGEANLYHWFSALTKYIAEKERLDYRPSSAGLSRSFHYDKENGESQIEKCSYDKPHAAYCRKSLEDAIRDFTHVGSDEEEDGNLEDNQDTVDDWKFEDDLILPDIWDDESDLEDLLDDLENWDD